MISYTLIIVQWLDLISIRVIYKAKYLMWQAAFRTGYIVISPLNASRIAEHVVCCSSSQLYTSLPVYFIYSMWLTSKYQKSDISS